MDPPPKRQKAGTSKQNLASATIRDVDEEESELEKLVFGEEDSYFISEIKKAVNENDGIDLGFYEDLNPESEAKLEETFAPLWVDEDVVQVNIQDTNRLRKLKKEFTEYSIDSLEFERRLRNQYEKLNPTPSWATQEPGISSSSVFKNTKVLSKKRILNPEKLRVMRAKDANQAQYSKVRLINKAGIKSVKFHPKVSVLLTAGIDKTLTLFQVDGKENEKIQSFRFQDLPIISACFNTAGTEIVVTGRRNFFYFVDLVSGNIKRIHGIRGIFYLLGRDEKSFERSQVSKCGEYLAVMGKDGYVILLSMKTKHWVANLKMNSLSVTVAFTLTHLFSLGLDGVVYQWDLESKQCTHRFIDQGCVKGSALAISNDEKFIAVGSQSGIVNVYELETCMEKEYPEPAKVIENLITTISTIVFHPSSDLMAIASHDVKDSLRIFHLPTLRVVKNWPTEKTPLGHVSDVAFSPDGEYIAIGNGKGKALLYALQDYQ